jgi:predicted O-methyltransferase YrrM
MRMTDPGEIASILRRPGLDAEWPGCDRRITALFATAPSAGAVNPGDRRALFYLVRHFKPTRVLEIGSNVGGSTLSMAIALRLNMDDGADPCSLTTVDKRDVNALWGGGPRDRVASIGMAAHVDFVVSGSAEYLGATEARFDFVFIDGDHDTDAVLRDMAGVLRCLGRDGIVVLHDYFPGGQPLWSNNKVIAGPYHAIEQLRRDGAAITAIPLGELPWSTKLGSGITSLAVLSPLPPTGTRSGEQ